MMDRALFDKLLAKYERLNPEKIFPPMLPPDVIISEARELLDALQEDEALRQPLEDLGINAEELALAREAVHFAQLAQQRWMEVTSHRHITQWSELEHQAEAVRAEIIASVRYHMRHDPRMMNELHEIHEGEGAADLILDLDTLARFLRTRPRVFRADPRFDPLATAERARELARSLREMMFELPDDTERDTVRRLRNLTFSYLRQHIAEIRAAGQYRFWNDDTRARIFLSKWRGEHVII